MCLHAQKGSGSEMALRKFTAILVAVILTSCTYFISVPVFAGVTTITFEDAEKLISDGSWHTTEYGNYYKGPGRECAFDADHYTETNAIPAGSSVTLNNVEAFGGAYWGCWSVSNIHELTGEPDGSSSFWLQGGNQFSSLTLNGAQNSDTYAIAYDGEACGFGPCPIISFGESVNALGFSLNNTPWPWYGAAKGDSFAGIAEKGYWFRLTVTGRDAFGGVTGVKEIMLMDFLGESFRSVTDWTSIDLTDVSDVQDAIFFNENGSYLTAYGTTPQDVAEYIQELADGNAKNTFENVESLEFRLSGTDGGMYGLNIAAYFALDDLMFSTLGPETPALPEPSAVLLFLFGCTLLSAHFLRKKLSSELFFNNVRRVFELNKIKEQNSER